MATTDTVVPVVERSLICVGCGYDLRAQPLEGRCPECGLSVQLALTLGGELAATRPGYARRLAWASAMLLGARVVAFVTAIVPLVTRHPGPLTYVGWLGASLLCLVGAWLLTVREHPHLPARFPWTARGMRALAVVGAILFAPTMVAELGFWNLLPLWLSGRMTDYLLMAGVVVYMIYPMLEMRVIVALSRRVSDMGLRQRAVVSGIAASAPGLAIGLIVLIIEYFRWRPQNAEWVGPVVGLLVCVLLVGWLWTAWNCLLACRIFARAGRDAALRWKEQPGTAQ